MLKRILSVLAWPGRKLIGLERQGRSTWSLALVDAAGLAMWLFTLDGYFFHRPLDQDDYSAVLGLALLGNAASLLYVSRPGRPWWHWAAKAVLGEVLAVAILRGVFVKAGLNLTGSEVVKLFASYLPWLLATRLVHLAGRRLLPRAPLECVRLALVAGAGFFFFGGRFVTSGSVGSGDSQWYCTMVADFVKQWRAGAFPVFVGQSEYAFNGAVSPLRLAPGLQHAAGMVDLLTGQSLPFYTLQNLALMLAALGGIFSAYFCAAAILPRQRWAALALSVLYLACPGVLSLGYQGDLYMSMMALPFVPLVGYGIWRTLQAGERPSIAWTVLPLAAAWYCHPPIALWLTLASVLGHLAIGLRHWRDPRLYAWWGRGLALFALAAAYPFVSVTTLRLPSFGSDVDAIVGGVRSVFPAVLLPISESTRALSDYQLGWTWWGLLVLSAAAWTFRPRRAEGVLLLGAGVMLLLLTPVPRLNAALWHAVPATIRNITSEWPMQRFYAVLAGLAVVAAAGTWSRLALSRLLWRALAALGLFVGVAWSWSEGSAFVFHDYYVRGPAPTPVPEPMLAPNNIALTRYSFNPFPFLPPYFSHGYLDPYLENRVLSPNQRTMLASNAAAARPADTAEQIPLIATYDGSRSAYLLPQFPINPGKRYAVRFAPFAPLAKGALVAAGPNAIRMYYLPDSGLGMNRLGPGEAFGLGPANRDFFPLWTSLPGPEAIGVRYVFDVPPPTGVPANFGRLYLQAYAVENLPIKISSWIPYRAETTASMPGSWLETPRMYIPGYAATVNGRPAKVAKSPGGLVAVALQPGANEIVLRYPGPWPLRVAYWTALLTWAAVLVAVARRGVGLARSLLP